MRLKSSRGVQRPTSRQAQSPSWCHGWRHWQKGFCNPEMVSQEGRSNLDSWLGRPGLGNNRDALLSVDLAGVQECPRPTMRNAPGQVGLWHASILFRPSVLPAAPVRMWPGAMLLQMGTGVTLAWRARKWLNQMPDAGLGSLAWCRAGVGTVEPGHRRRPTEHVPPSRGRLTESPSHRRVGDDVATTLAGWGAKVWKMVRGIGPGS